MSDGGSGDSRFEDSRFEDSRFEDGARPAVRIGYRVGDRYEITGRIATGGMAEVWRALDTVLDRPVAVKILHPHLATDRAFLLRFRREAVAAARLSHPSIVAIYDTVSSPGLEAIVMELIEGRTLREVLDDVGTLTTEDTTDLGLQVSEALDEAHRGGVVHRDIKPSNILLCTDRRIMVTDFGIAKAGEDTDLTVTGTLLGTAKYLSPEQVNGDEVDPRSDLYSLGVVLFEASTGRPPFWAETDAATALARLHNDPPRPSDLAPSIPPALESIIERLLSREPNGRFDRARDLRAALSGLPFSSTAGSGVIGENDPTRIGLNETTMAAQPHTGSASQAADSNAPSRTEAFQTEALPATGLPATPRSSDADYASDAVSPSDADSAEEDGFVHSERSWLIPAMVLLLLGAGLLVAAVLLSRSPLATASGTEGSGDESESNGSNDGGTDTTSLTRFDEVVEVAIVGASSFDPEGDGAENEQLVANAFDDDDETSWRTETYRGPLLGRLKSGVGLLVELAGPSSIDEIELETDSVDWTIEIFVGDDFTGPSSSWGEPVERVVYDGDDRIDIDTGGAIGSQVLVWVTDPGTSPDRDDQPGDDYRFEIAEITLS